MFPLGSLFLTRSGGYHISRRTAGPTSPVTTRTTNNPSTSTTGEIVVSIAGIIAVSDLWFTVAVYVNDLLLLISLLLLIVIR